MDKHLTSNIIHGPWSTRNDSSASAIQAFRQDLKQHLEMIGTAETSISEVCQLFDVSRFVNPIECNITQTALNGIHQPVHLLCHLLSNVRHLPSSIIICRYDLLAPLCYVDEKIPWLNRQLALFRSVCLDSSRQTLEQQQMIENQLVRIIQSSKTIESKGLDLLNQV